MINIGCFANYNYTYKSEVKFAKDNNFKLLQIWYDKSGLTLTKDENALQAILDNPYPSIIHALLDIRDFNNHIPKLLDILIKLKHNELIIHPVCKYDVDNPKNINILSKLVHNANTIFKANNIKLFIENNSKLDKLFNSPEDINFLFQQNPDIHFLFDIAHVESEEQIKEIIK